MFKKHLAYVNLTQSQQQAVLWKSLMGSRLYLGLGVLYLLVAIGLMWLLFTVGRESAVRVYLLSAVFVMNFSIFPIQRVIRNRRMAGVLLELGIRPSHCGRCEFDLRASEGDNCPECGAKLASDPMREP